MHTRTHTQITYIKNFDVCDMLETVNVDTLENKDPHKLIPLHYPTVRRNLKYEAKSIDQVVATFTNA